MAVSGCGGPGAGTVTSVGITCAAASVPINQQTTCSAVVNLADNTSTTSQSTSTAVTWQVNGTSGGVLTTTGSITNVVNNVQAGLYTAPPTVPGTNNGQVLITAIAPKDPSKSTSTTTDIVTSNQVTISVGGGLGLVINPPLTPTVPAGGTHLFTADLNGVADPNATWMVTPVNGGNAGAINPTSGLYTAPVFPPPGALVTITATDAAAGANATATTTAQVAYSDVTLHGFFAFSYTGNDSDGFLAAAGSFFADGQGHITSGVQDASSFLTGISAEQLISSTSTYSVTPDGRGQANLKVGGGSQSETLEFVLTTNAHAIITRFDSSATGSGSMDAQGLTFLSGASSSISGAYVFNAVGTDGALSSSQPEGIAGEFSTPGNGTIPNTNALIDVHDGATSSGVITRADSTLNGSYCFDTAGCSGDNVNTGTGRGLLTLTSTSTGTLLFAFYIVDNTHLNIMEIDGKSYLAGSVYSAATGPFSAGNLASGNYPFTAGGMTTVGTSIGGYGLGGIFTSNGTGSVSGGSIDTNTAGASGASTVKTNVTLVSCAYTVDPATGRTDLALFTGTGACPSGSGTGLTEFAAYPTNSGSFVLLEIDSNALTVGNAYAQQSAPASLSTGGFALGLASQGIFANTSGVRPPFAQNVDGEFSAVSTLSGFLDVNFLQPFGGVAINSTTSIISGPGTTGRGTISIVAGLGVTYNVIYYFVGNNQVLLLDQDPNNTLILTGTVQRQF